MEPKVLLQRLQEPATRTYSEPVESTPISLILFLEDQFHFSSSKPHTCATKFGSI
jgi:hypothetical protein